MNPTTAMFVIIVIGVLLCRYMNQHLGFCSHPTEIAMATALHSYVSVYICHVAWAIQAEAWVCVSVGILGVAWQPGSVALVDEGDIKSHVGAEEDTLETSVCVFLHLIKPQQHDPPPVVRQSLFLQ